LMLLRCLTMVLLCISLGAYAQSASGSQTVVHVLDYIGVDYAGAVDAGRVKDESEYKEMLEFTQQVQEQLSALPPNPSQAQLISDAQQLAKLVSMKADAAAVSAAAAKLRWA